MADELPELLPEGETVSGLIGITRKQWTEGVRMMVDRTREGIFEPSSRATLDSTIPEMKYLFPNLPWDDATDELLGFMLMCEQLKARALPTYMAIMFTLIEKVKANR